MATMEEHTGTVVATKRVLGVNRLAHPAHGFISPPKPVAQSGDTAAIAPVCGAEPRQLGNGPQIYFAPVAGQAIGGALADIYVQLPFQCKVFFIASIKTPQNSVFFHLTPLGKNYAGGNIITPNGTEDWISMTSQIVATGAPYYLTVLKFKNPIQAFYVDSGNENGQPNAFTIACLKDEDALDISGGPYD